MNQKGFVSLCLVIWAPLFLTILSYGLWMVWLINQKHQLNNLCHHHLLKSQQALVDGNNRLLLHNPKALALILEKRNLDRLILTSPPPVKAAALLKRKRVLAQQIKLSLLQKNIIKTHKELSKSWAQKLRLNLHRALRKRSEFFQGDKNILAQVRVRWSISRIKIKFRDKASTYQRGTNHALAQTMSANWSIPLQSVTPPWLSPFVKNKNNWLGSCQTHPDSSGGLKWYAAIGGGKVLSRPLSSL